MKPSIPSGTRDFSPSDMVKRNYILQTIRTVFERYGYQPIETPAMENLTTLLGKYGEEGDKLIFKIINSGDYLLKATEIKKVFESDDFKKEIEEAKKELSSNPNLNLGNVFAQGLEKIPELSIVDFVQQMEDFSNLISEKALRYDLTVPFARYVVQHQHEITFPFKRYQIQPVWRADRPQKGRYREFFQCDADVVGSDSLLNEVEMVQLIVDVFENLKIPVTIRYNNRKILSGLKDVFGMDDKKVKDIIIAIDKYEKIQEKVFDELEEKGFSNETVKKLKEFSSIASESEVGKERHEIVKKYFSKSEIGLKGFAEIEQLNQLLVTVFIDKPKDILDNIRHSFYLARGLDYYTGTIFEVKANGVQIGSICGGGRYDDLTGVFGLSGVSGVGISFGIDRIFDVLEELKLFDKIGLTVSTTKVLLTHFGEEERNYCIGIASQLRSAGINTEIYPDITKKISKQLEYANKKQIPYVIVIGSDEMKTGELTMKNMDSREQKKMKLQPLIILINTN